jgi:hypothetical protein
MMSSPNEKNAEVLLRLIIDARVELVKHQRTMGTLAHRELAEAAIKFNTMRGTLRDLENLLEKAINAAVKERCL